MIYLDTKVLRILEKPCGQIVETTSGTFETKYLINCTGLYSDRIARLGGINPRVRIIPFRGEYYELKFEKRYLVKNLVYPVPNPNFPFLGVHFTRMINGSVHVGPNAVISFKREGYKKTDFNLRDFTEIVTYPGFWLLVVKHIDQGIQEMIRSFSKAAFVQSLQRLIPEIQSNDLIPTHAGVRAQALLMNGQLIQHFSF